jgi:hypothetical protein
MRRPKLEEGRSATYDDELWLQNDHIFTHLFVSIVCVFCILKGVSCQEMWLELQSACCGYEVFTAREEEKLNYLQWITLEMQIVENGQNTK